jgi:tRNA dimethylallyltransferase
VSLQVPRIVVLVGPTAVGKSRLAMTLAEEFDAEIISADSRQVYRYMDIGTAKPSGEERARIKHHMIDLVEPNDTYSARRFTEEGTRVLAAIANRGKLALVVGGTGFYIRGLLDGMSIPRVSPNAELRIRLRDEAAAHGPEVLHARLAGRDPVSAARIHPNNLPRLVRALEIVEQLGTPVPTALPTAALPALFLGLTMERSDMYTAADIRVRAQVDAGLLDEAHNLLSMGYPRECPALTGFGYREMIAFIDGRCDLPTAIAGYQGATRRYIRRQYTWFNADPRIQWLDARSQQDRALSLVDGYLRQEPPDPLFESSKSDD